MAPSTSARGRLRLSQAPASFGQPRPGSVNQPLAGHMIIGLVRHRRILDEEGVTDPFIRNWLDMICFLLQGTLPSDAPTTLMAYMLSDFYRPGVALDFPKGGTQAIVEALVRGVTKHEGSHVRLNTHVAQLLIDEEAGRAVGVATADGGRVMARKAVISNADLWSTRRLVTAAVGSGAAGSVRAKLTAELQARVDSVQRCDSFLHLHLGIDAAGLPSVPSEAFPAQWAVVKDWEVGVNAPRNLVLVSIACSCMCQGLQPQVPEAATPVYHKGYTTTACTRCSSRSPRSSTPALPPRAAT